MGSSALTFGLFHLLVKPKLTLLSYTYAEASTAPK